MSAQKVIITLTDNGEGKVGLQLDFDPALKTDSKPTPAVLLAMDMVEFVTKNNPLTKAPEVVS